VSKESFDFKGRVALVTGGSRGLGRAIALALAEKGASIVICSRKQENLDQAMGTFRQAGLACMSRVANVGESQPVSELFQEIEKNFGKLDILVNNVGMNILTPSVVDAEESLWDKIIQTNLKGPFLCSRYAVKLMRKGGCGKIINIGSVAAKKATRGMGIYCIAKAGLEMLNKILAIELAGDNINVNAVAPCMVKTRFSQPFWSNNQLLKEITRNIPLGRIAEPDDVVGSVLFLASSLSDFITGEVIHVDGGNMA
jgi:NAD(P)-dependent dehydrogenase (short-subunit alcohol dehydrogenase family)